MATALSRTRWLIRWRKTTDKDPVWIATGHFRFYAQFEFRPRRCQQRLEHGFHSSRPDRHDRRGDIDRHVLAGHRSGDRQVAGFRRLRRFPRRDRNRFSRPGRRQSSRRYDLDLSGQWRWHVQAPTLVRCRPASRPLLSRPGRSPTAATSIWSSQNNPTRSPATPCQIQVLLGNGDGTFSQAPQSPYVVGNAPTFVAAADFNADGVTDLAVTNSGAPSTATDGTAVTGNSVSILFGNPNRARSNIGDGTFTTPTAYAAGTGPTSIAVADYNHRRLS